MKDLPAESPLNVSRGPSAENPYQKILAAIGIATFWICLSSFLHERFSSDLSLPLDPFEHSKSRGSEIMWGILVCWSMFTVVNIVGWRLAVANRGHSSLDRLPDPFGLGKAMLRPDRKVYLGIFTIVFYILPYIHVVQFALRFFFLEESKPVWLWTKHSWFSGEHDYYLGAFYYGWFPFLAILLAGAAATSSIVLVRSISAQRTESGAAR